MANKDFVVKNGLTVASGGVTIGSTERISSAGLITGVVNTQAEGTDSMAIASTAFVQQELASLVDSAPSTLNTLNELAAALGDDASFSTTVTNSIAAKLPLAGGTLTGDLTIPSKIIHAGDTDTYLRFSGADDFRIVVGNSTRAAFNTSKIHFNQEGINQDFQVEGQGTGNEGLLYVDASTNKVGIGTSSPSEKLHVEGSVVIDAFNAGDETGIFFREGFSSSNKYNVSILAKDHNGSSADGLSINGYDGVSFCTGSNSRQERMRIDTTGKVGIGNTSPSHKLDVTGTIRTYASGSGNAWLYTQNDNKIYLTGVRGSSSNAFTIYDLTEDHSRFRVNSDGGIAIGEDNVGYAGQILSVKSGTGNNVLYGESSDADCIVSLRDNSSTQNIGFGATGNAHVFKQDGTEIARISTGSSDKYSYNGGGLGGSGTNLHLHSDDSEIKMANNIIHSDNSGNTKFTIRTGYGATSSAAELSLDGGYISFNTGTSFTERARINSTGIFGVGGNPNTGLSNSAASIQVIAPTTATHDYSATSFNAGSLLSLDANNGQNHYAAIRFTHNGNTEGFFGLVRDSSTSDITDFVWQGYDGDSNTYKEYMRINHNGKVSIANNAIISSSATTWLAVGDGSGSGTISIYTGSSHYGYLNFADGTSGASADPGYMRYNHNDNTFYFNRSVSGPSFSSDISRKENIVDIDNGWNVIKDLKPRIFDWKKDDLTGD